MTPEQFVFSELLRILQQLPPWAAETVQEYRTLLSEAQAERDALQAECDALRRGHDKTHQLIDRALAVLTVDRICYHFAQRSGNEAKRKLGQSVIDAIEILTGEMDFESEQEYLTVLSALKKAQDQKIGELQARVDGALAALGETSKPALWESFWRALDNMVAAQNKAIEILTGEGE